MASESPPLYQQIRDTIRSGIASGALAAGEKLPSESELARQFGTTRLTVRQALSQLVFEGIVITRNGRGSFVSNTAVIHSPIDSRQCLSFEEQVALTGRTVTYGACTFTLTKASDEVAKRLWVEPGRDVFQLQRVREIDGKPVCLELRYIDHDIGRRITGEMLARQAVYRFVAEILGEPLPTLSVSITAISATPEMAEVLDVPVNAALIVRDNTHHAKDGSPKVWGRSIYRGDVRTDYVLGQPLPPSSGIAPPRSPKHPAKRKKR